PPHLHSFPTRRSSDLGPGTLAGRYLRTFWQPVARSQDLRRGDALPIHIMNERLTLYRGESGATYAVAFRCAHRGTQLSTGWVEEDRKSTRLNSSHVAI